MTSLPSFARATVPPVLADPDLLALPPSSLAGGGPPAAGGVLLPSWPTPESGRPADAASAAPGAVALPQAVRAGQALRRASGTPLAPYRLPIRLAGMSDIGELLCAPMIAEHPPEYLERLVRQPRLNALDVVAAALGGASYAPLAYELGRQDSDALGAQALRVARDRQPVGDQARVTLADGVATAWLTGEALRFLRALEHWGAGTAPAVRSVWAAYARGMWDGVARQLVRATAPDTYREEQQFALGQGTMAEAEARARWVAVLRDEALPVSRVAAVIERATGVVAEAWQRFSRGEEGATAMVLRASARIALVRDVVRAAERRVWRATILETAATHGRRRALDDAVRALGDPEASPFVVAHAAGPLLEMHAEWLYPALGFDPPEVPPDRADAPHPLARLRTSWEQMGQHAVEQALRQAPPPVRAWVASHPVARGAARAAPVVAVCRAGVRGLAAAVWAFFVRPADTP